jgi:metal iron transporter
MRRLITRLLAIIPSMVVAIAMGRRGIDGLLIASQVVLSVVLPFVTFPLLWCTSSKAIMSVRKAKRTTDTSSPTADLPTLVATPPTYSPPVGKDTATSPTLAPPSPPQSPPTPGSPSGPLLGKGATSTTPSSGKIPDSPKGVEAAEEDEMVDYSNNKVAIVIGAIIWLVVVAANVYVLVDLGIQAGK